MIKIKAFKAVEDLEGCLKYSEGHERVLESFGVQKVTSAQTDWFYDPNVYVIAVESLATGEYLGGAKISIRNGANVLPVEKAIGDMDETVYDLIAQYAQHGVGELCGLWNSRAAAGMGYSMLVTRACIAKASEISGLNTLFVLCAPYTVEMVENVGFELEPSLGMNGSFPYPRDDYKATVLVLHDIQKLSKAKLKDRNLIYELRNNPNLLRIEEGPLGNINAQYDMTGEGLGNQRISA